jgi:hypothetical protein
MVRITLRSYFSTYHLWGSRHFAERAQSIEDAHSGGSKFNVEHRALVIGAVVEVGAFLECAINEIFKDCVDFHDGYIKTLPRTSVHALRDKWTEWHANGRTTLPTLDKYEAAIACCGVASFDRGATPYQEAALLLRLRNALIHYTPESLAEDDPHRLGDALKSRFNENALMASSGNPYVPDKCLGAGCARWAFTSARAFADAFFARIGMTPNYQSSGFLGTHLERPGR